MVARRAVTPGVNCESPDPSNTLTERLNGLLEKGGAGYMLRLCPSKNYILQAPLMFRAPNQEISTVGYPTGNERATLTVMGPVSNGSGHTTAVDGTASNLNGVKLKNVQINGTRGTGTPTKGGASIEMGGGNSGQVVEYVRSYDPRSWSCLHVSEGPSVSCNGITIQFNDIGPCGSTTSQQWADGISLSCRNSIVRGNTIAGATDGGIVILGSPGSLVQNNTIVANQTLLSGINLVDVKPFAGNYSGVIVENNRILGGFATGTPRNGETLGSNKNRAIIKIGIATGPRVWAGSTAGDVKNFGGVIRNNHLSGALGYGIAVSGVKNFEVIGNVLTTSATFVGTTTGNCSTATPQPAPFVYQASTVESCTLQSNFVDVANADGLTCIQPPSTGNFWPYANSTDSDIVVADTGSTSDSSSSSASVGVAIGVIAAVLVAGVTAWFIRRRVLRRNEADTSRKEPNRMSEAYGGYIRYD